jgi:hypothetical protein
VQLGELVEPELKRTLDSDKPLVGRDLVGERPREQVRARPG